MLILTREVLLHLFKNMDHKTQNFRISKISKYAFYWVKTLNETKFDIIWSQGFKYAFINNNKTLNRYFNSDVSELNLF